MIPHGTKQTLDVHRSSLCNVDKQVYARAPENNGRTQYNLPQQSTRQNEAKNVAIRSNYYVYNTFKLSRETLFYNPVYRTYMYTVSSVLRTISAMPIDLPRLTVHCIGFIQQDNLPVENSSSSNLSPVTHETEFVSPNAEEYVVPPSSLAE